MTPRRERVLDAVVVGVGLLGVVWMVRQHVGPVAVVLSALEIAPLAVRRTRPMLCFSLVAGAMVLQLPLSGLPIYGQVAMPVAVYSVAAFAPRRQARTALVVALLGGVVGPARWLVATLPGTATDVLALVVITELLVIAPWTMGSLARTRRAYVAELEDRGRRLEREAAARAELAASDERARIAREMHDVVAHGLTVMVVQADGARYAVAKDPGSAARALETISATGRESLAEMRRMLGLLRSESGSGTRPQPGLADLGFLLEESRASGMDLRATVTEPLPVVPAGTGLTVYRVVQEGLTNVRKHAGPGVRAEVEVTVPEPGRLVVLVCDDGRGPGVGAAPGSAPGRTSGGHGVVGMRERVALHGGRLQAGPRPGGGFLLRADLPLDADLAATAGHDAGSRRDGAEP